MKTVKAIVFDLDGVLFEARDLHRIALDRALVQYSYPPISDQDHLSVYNGLPTKTKLKMLGIEGPIVEQISAAKQRATLDLLRETCKFDPGIYNTLLALKTVGYRLAIASNSVRDSVNLMVSRLGLNELIEFSLSNEDVSNPKPHPEIYLSAANRLGLSPEEIVVVEDSPHGIRACLESGCILCQVSCPTDVRLLQIVRTIIDYQGTI